MIIGDFLNALTTRGKKVKQSGNGWEAQCPAHDDATPSLSIAVAKQDGKILLTCHRQCTTEAITAALGLTMADLFAHPEPEPERVPLPFARKPAKNETLVATYEYTDLETGAIAEKGRWELSEVGADGKHRKTFRWRWQGSPSWSGGPEMARLALWGHDTLLTAPADATVYFVEGEAATLACRAAGLLAVTHAGGASTKDFGLSLEVLRGRNVVLWPDNDATGRDFMTIVHSRIRDLAANVAVISVPLPPKGDAVEYFSDGGTITQLEQTATRLTATAVEYIGVDHLKINVPTLTGTVTFDFDELRKGPRSLDAELTIAFIGPVSERTPYVERINLLSASARTELRRDLETIYGKEYGWPKLLNSVFALTREKFLAQDRSVDAFDIVPLAEEELFFHDPLIPMNQITIFFGDRDSTKSYLAYYITLCAAMGEEVLGQRVPQGPVLVIDYEDEERNFRRRLDRLAAGMGIELLPGIVHYMNLMGMPLTDADKAIRAKILKDGIIAAIVDTLGPAVGGDPSATDMAIATMQTMRTWGTTVIALAHVPKNGSGDQPKDPFGSVFYSNLSRRTWYVERVQEEESDVVEVGLYPKKANDGARPRPIAVRLTFDGRNGPVRVERTDMASIPALQQKRGMKEQVFDILKNAGRLTVFDIARRMDIDTEKKGALKPVENILSSNPETFVVVGNAPSTGGRPPQLWGLLNRQYFSDAQ